MEVKIQYEVGLCNQFRRNGADKNEDVSVVISPLKVVGEGEKIRIISGCNLFRSCHNPDCWFSVDGRKAGTPA